MNILAHDLYYGRVTTPLSTYEAAIRSAQSPADLDALEQQIFGRKNGALTTAMKELSAMPQDERVKKGQELNQWKQTLTEALMTRRKELSSKSAGELETKDKLDVTLELPPRERGHLHLIP